MNHAKPVMKTLATVFAAVLLCASAVQCPLHAEEEESIGWSVAKFIGGYLGGKILDGIWDSANGKPDVNELKQRIQTLESSIGGPSPSLDALRDAIHPDMSVDEYKRLVSTALPGVANILSDHERRLRALEGDTAAAKNKSLGVASYWNHNGSTMGLFVQGNRRIIVYVKPRAGLQGLVAPGTVLFSGVTSDDKYFGKARRFSAGLPPIEYSVSGPIQRDGSRIQLNGRASVRNPDGSIKETFDDVLTFVFVSTNK